MSNYNRVILMGNLTRDPELRFVGADKWAVCQFGMAINRKRKDKEEVTYVDIECWGRMAEVIAEHLKKGRKIHIEGRLKLDQWEDREGAKRQKLKVVAESFQFVDNREQTVSGAADLSRPNADLGEDDIPF